MKDKQRADPQMTTDEKRAPVTDTMADAAEMLWVVLANVNGGDWTQQSPEWREAAVRWRDNYFAALKSASTPSETTLAPRREAREEIGTEAPASICRESSGSSPTRTLVGASAPTCPNCVALQGERDLAVREKNEAVEEIERMKLRAQWATERFHRWIGPLRVAARECGYALAVHGSLVRDIDLIAVAWTADAVEPPTLIEALRAACDGYLPKDDRSNPYDRTKWNPDEKPHGRLAWKLLPSDGKTFFDVSVCGPLTAAEALRDHLEKERDELLLDRHQPHRVASCGHYRVFVMPCGLEDGSEIEYCMQCDRDRLQDLRDHLIVERDQLKEDNEDLRKELATRGAEGQPRRSEPIGSTAAGNEVRDGDSSEKA